MFQVQKKDGSLTDFDRSKIVNGVIMSGATPEQAEQVAAGVDGWLPTVMVNNVVKTADIRVKLLEILKAINPAAGATFESYQKV
ncbi:MAG: hypothetical protein UU09_C0046G0012 [Microgenomates group bacterium GW2011_GWA2_40_6]|nr:MAG: hypothetical protein UU09_C0046G0012 [Microgenomates group bacterium GW2011_GWA2_40_6]